MQNLIHVANVLLLLSFLVRNVLWLRLLNLLAGAAFIAYFASSDPPAIAPLVWNALFLSINVVQGFCLLVERRAAPRRAQATTRTSLCSLERSGRVESGSANVTPWRPKSRASCGSRYVRISRIVSR
jgi:hypothetical protein